MNLLERCHVMHRAWRFRLKHDRHEIAYLHKHVSLGDTVVDIGANKGAYTYWLSKAVGPQGHVFAYEPQPALASFLNDQRACFGWSNTKIINAGLSSQAGELDLLQPRNNPLGGATLESRPESAGKSYIRVQIETLDELLQQDFRQRVSFIKCDVEGHEQRVFEGGERLLREHRPILLFECQKCKSEELFPYLRSLGYSGRFAFINARSIPFAEFAWRGELEGLLGNFVFVHERQQMTGRAA